MALTCTAGTFDSCKDSNTELTCDSSGTSLDVMACANGCDPTFGCRVCAPSATACAAGVTQTCDATGAVTSSETCPVGCSADGTRCAKIAPSNGLGMYFDMTPSPVDLTLAGTLDLADGTMTGSDGVTKTTLPSFDVPAPTGGAPIRVFVGAHVIIEDLVVSDSSGNNQGRALAVLATGELDVTGRVELDNTGAVDLPGCTGSAGGFVSILDGPSYRGGGGGGGHATAGAAGGVVTGQAGAGSGAAGSASGTDTLTPLRGGCPAGFGGFQNFGGGAVQLVSATTLTISGVLVVDGMVSAAVNGLLNEGGGGGGGVLAEAPTISIGPSARLLARGGPGTALASIDEATPPDNGSAIPGEVCEPTSDTRCENGGNGASVASPPTVGADVPTIVAGDMHSVFGAGGGGGGLGRVRFNALTAVTVPPTATVAAAMTTGTLATQ